MLSNCPNPPTHDLGVRAIESFMVCSLSLLGPR